MNNNEFSVEFDLLYNNALSNSAPEVNLFEKSLFLTASQDEIIKELYDSSLNNTFYEKTEKIRRRLESTVKTDSVAFDSSLNSSLVSTKIDSTSKFFKISDDAWYITYDRIKNSSTSRYVVPVSLDQYDVLSSDPFKAPNTRRAWRLDLGKAPNGDRIVEVVTDLSSTGLVYYYRFINKPTPIVLCDVESYVGPGYSIDGVTVETECKMPQELHREIVKRAVEKATLAYKENNLQNNVQLNKRVN